MSHISRMCDGTLVLESGKTAFFGDAEQGVLSYERLNEDKGAETESFLSLSPPLTEFDYKLLPSPLRTGNDIEFHISCRSTEMVEDFVLRILLYNGTGALCM